MQQALQPQQLHLQPVSGASPIGGKEDKTFSLGGSDTRCRGDSIAQWRTPKDVRGLQDHLRPGCGGEAIVGFRVKSLHRLWSVWPTRAKDPQEVDLYDLYPELTRGMGKTGTSRTPGL